MFQTKEENQAALAQAIHDVMTPEKTGQFHFDGFCWMEREIGGRKLRGLGLSGDYDTPDALVVPLPHGRVYVALGVEVDPVAKTVQVPATTRVLTLEGADFTNIRDMAEKIVSTLIVLSIQMGR